MKVQKRRIIEIILLFHFKTITFSKKRTLKKAERWGLRISKSNQNKQFFDIFYWDFLSFARKRCWKLNRWTWLKCYFFKVWNQLEILGFSFFETKIVFLDENIWFPWWLKCVSFYLILICQLKQESHHFDNVSKNSERKSFANLWWLEHLFWVETKD